MGELLKCCGCKSTYFQQNIHKIPTISLSRNSCIAPKCEIFTPFRGDEIIEQLPESLPGIGTIQGNDTVSGWWEQNTGKYVTEHLGQVSDWKYSFINKSAVFYVVKQLILALFGL